MNKSSKKQKKLRFIVFLLLFIGFNIYFCFNPVHVEGSALRVIGSKYIPYVFAVFGTVMLIAYIFDKKK
jgi:hypothetical protein